jgi:hypothetical protein
MNEWKTYIAHIAKSEFIDAMRDGEIYQWIEQDWTCSLKMNRWNDEYGAWEGYATGYKKGKLYKAWIYPDGFVDVF